MGDINTGWRLEARLMTLLSKKITVTKFEEVKTKWSIIIDTLGRIF
jgi:hypothetical protein